MKPEQNQESKYVFKDKNELLSDTQLMRFAHGIRQANATRPDLALQQIANIRAEHFPEKNKPAQTMHKVSKLREMARKSRERAMQSQAVGMGA